MRAPGGQMAGRDEARPDPEHEGIGYVAEKGHKGEVGGDKPLGRNPGLEVLLAEVAEALPGEAPRARRPATRELPPGSLGSPR